jgi:hypothetical protein
METAEERKIHAKKGSDVAAKKRSEKAKPFIDGVAAAYVFLRYGKPKEAGHDYLLACGWIPEFDFKIGCEHSAAINTLAEVTGRTPKRIRQIIKKARLDKGSHLVVDAKTGAKKSEQPSLFDSLNEP